MIHRSILIIVLSLCCIPMAPAAAPEPPHVTAYGNATINVIPDQLIWRLNVRTVDPTSAGAAKAHDSVVAGAMAFLKENRIAEEKIQTARMQLGEDWDYSRGERRLRGYFASTDVSFTLTDLSRYSSLWIGLAGLQGVHTTDVSLEHSDRIRYQNDARAKAVLAARDKASAMAQVLGATIGAPLAVEEEPAPDSPRPLSTSNVAAFESGSGPAEPSLAPGTIPIRTRVRAVFELRESRNK